MKKVLIILGFILCLGLILRFHNYARWPREGATFDEYAWTWQGMSLLETGIPTSWSPHKQYHTRTYFQNTKGASFFLVTPYLEHPPLFGLFVGSYAKLIGLKEFNDVSIEKIRPLALIMGLGSILAVFLLAHEIGGPIIGLLSAFLYAIMPSVVVGSRFVQNENFFIPLFLFSLFFVTKYLNTHKRLFLLVSIILSSLLPLAKVPWIAGPLAVIAVLLAHKKYRDAGLLIMTVVGFFSIYLWYGFRLDGDLFVKLWNLQLARYDITFEGLFALFRDPIISDRWYLDGLFYIGFIAFGVISVLKKKEHLPVMLGFLSYFCLFLFAIPNEPGHGWYRYPMYPFLTIMIAIMLKEYFNKNMILSFLTILILGLAALSTSWQRAFGFSYGIYRGFLFLSAIGLLTLIFPQRWIVKWSKVINFCMLALVLGLVIWSGWGYTEQ